MKALIVFDSVYGNTEKVARAVAEALTPSGDVKVLRAGEANPSEFRSIDLLIVGSPTHGGRPTPAIKEFIGKIPANALAGVGVASFDTRMKIAFARLFGYAAGRIADGLKEKGGRPVAPPEGFIVEDRDGPLREGELERATGWAKGILKR